MHRQVIGIRDNREAGSVHQNIAGKVVRRITQVHVAGTVRKARVTRCRLLSDRAGLRNAAGRRYRKGT